MQQSINRAFDILEFVGDKPDQPKSFSEIAQKTGLNTGTCANIMKALATRGYLQKLEDKRGYQLGNKLYQLTGFDGYSKNLSQAAQAIIEKLTGKINENLLVAVLKGSSRIVICEAKSSQEIQVVLANEKHAYDSSTGRLLLAMMPDEELEKFIRSYGLPLPEIWKEAASRKKFFETIELIRKKEFAIQEMERQISGIAVAIRDRQKVVGGLGVYLPSFRLAQCDQEKLVTDLKKAAQQISQKL